MGAAEASRGAKWMFDLAQKGKGGKVAGSVGL